MVRVAKLLTRQRLLDQGVALLTEHGYHGTGLQAILAEVQVPKGSFYNYFASKEEFAAAAIGHYIEPFLKRLDAALIGAEGDPLQALRGYFEALLAELEQRRFKGGCLLGNLIGEVADTNEVCLGALRDAVHRYRDQLAVALEAGQRFGSVRSDLPATVLADLLSDAWQGALLRMKVERSVQPLAAVLTHLLDGYFRPPSQADKSSG